MFPQAPGTQKFTGWLQPLWRPGSEREQSSPFAIACGPDQAHWTPLAENRSLSTGQTGIDLSLNLQIKTSEFITQFGGVYCKVPIFAPSAKPN